MTLQLLSHLRIALRRASHPGEGIPEGKRGPRLLGFLDSRITGITFSVVVASASGGPGLRCGTKVRKRRGTAMPCPYKIPRTGSLQIQRRHLLQVLPPTGDVPARRLEQLLSPLRLRQPEQAEPMLLVHELVQADAGGLAIELERRFA